MKLKQIYKKNKNMKYRKIEGIKQGNFALNSSPLNFIKKYKYIILAITIIIIALLYLIFRNNFKLFLCVIAFFAIIEILSIISNNYKITGSIDGITIKTTFKEVNFPSTSLETIYLSRTTDFTFIIPIVTYNLAFRYVDMNNFIREFEFSTFFTNSNDLEKFLNNLILSKENANELVNFEKTKLLKKIAKYVAIVLVLIIFIIAYIAKF